MIRVLIVDDHQIVRMGIVGYLETYEDFEVVGEAATGREAIEKCLGHNPDAVVLDLLLPDMSGVDVIQALRNRGITCPVLILSSTIEDHWVVQAMQAGALSYLDKTSGAPEIAAALKKAVRGETVLSEAAQRVLVGRLKASPETKPWEELTDRELDVLRTLATGKSNQEIADILGIGIKTVKTHVSNILVKLNVQDRTQAAILAIREGLA